MPAILIYTGVFLVVLFLYIHIVYQGKCNEESNVVTVPVKTPSVLEDMCNLRIPFSFQYHLSRPIKDCHVTDTSHGETVWKTLEIERGSDEDNLELERLVDFTRPYMNVNTRADYYEDNSDSSDGVVSSSCNRLFLCNYGENRTISLWSPNTSRNVISTYDSLSSLRVSHDEMPESTIEYKLESNCVLCVPPFWWFSVSNSTGDSKDTTLLMLRFRSLSNAIRNVHEIVSTATNAYSNK